MVIVAKLFTNVRLKQGVGREIGECYISSKTAPKMKVCMHIFILCIGKKSQNSKQKLVTGFQINFLCIDPDQVNHLMDLRGGIQKIWEFHLPY